jgi:hypothetical protein
MWCKSVPNDVENSDEEGKRKSWREKQKFG